MAKDLTSLGIIIVCKKCGGANVQHVAWYYPNKGYFDGSNSTTLFGSGGDFGEWNDDPSAGRTWCEDCQEHTILCECPLNGDTDECETCSARETCKFFSQES